ncbi:MAG: asparagine synthase B [Halobacteriovoraceae bacterium]|nr:asparagine synthase B [Halobacteriovoraceae bacterium]
MCGILAAFGTTDYERAIKQSKLLNHRGPDESGHQILDSFKDGAILCHERLSIIDLNTGKQPIQGMSEECWVIHNGEIYNHEDLRLSLTKGQVAKTKSDSEIIVHLYEELGVESVHQLDGVFSFVLTDRDKIFAARDPLGVKPLFYGKGKGGSLWFSSEIKALVSVCETIETFPPGHYYHSDEGFVCYYTPTYHQENFRPTEGPEKIKELLTKAVQKRLMSDAPLGVLLSGGLDSSLVTSIVVREAKKVGQKVKSFSIGMDPNSHDLLKARKAAEFLGTEHHEIIFTVEDGLAALKELIYKTESYDVTTTRASVPMLIMSKYISSLGVKVVLSGEGADEIFGGYLYFTEAPSADEFHKECVRRVKRLHTSDVLRADRATMGAAVEARVPFLDKEFIEYAMSISPDLKEISPGVRCEKYILREAFNDKTDPFLPEEILWRQKEQFSDGVGYTWIDELKKYAESEVSTSMLAAATKEFPYNTPETKEAYLIREIWESFFSHPSTPKLIKKWVPKWQKNKDPSGRANKVHNEKYSENIEELTRT